MYDLNTQDRKILDWDYEDYNSFVGSFTVSELLDLLDVIDDFPPSSCDNHEDYGYCIVSNAAGIIYNYVSQKLKDLIEIHAVGEEIHLATAYLKTLAALTP